MRIVFVLGLLLGLAVGSAAAGANPFFVFDNGIKDAQHTTIDSQLDLVKAIGFDGLSWRTDSPQRVRELLDGVKKRGLKVFVIYVNLDLKDGKLVYDPRIREIMAACKGTDTMIWPNMTSKQFKNSAPEGDEIAVAGLRELADLAAANGLRIAIYPHVNMWVHRVEDALRLVKKVDRKNVGLTFNLCHCLLDGGEQRIAAILDEIAPYLFVVSINGADSGASKSEMGRMIQPLDRGTFDVSAVMKKLDAIGYKGPVGLQCYNIKGDIRQLLSGSMAAWKRMQAGESNSPESRR